MKWRIALIVGSSDRALDFAGGHRSQPARCCCRRSWSPEAMREKARFVLGVMEQGMTALGFGWRMATGRGRMFAFSIDHYLDERAEWISWRGIRVKNYHRPLGRYMTLFLGAGLRLTHSTNRCRAAEIPTRPIAIGQAEPRISLSTRYTRLSRANQAGAGRDFRCHFELLIFKMTAMNRLTA